jgi:ribosomal protein L11
VTKKQVEEIARLKLPDLNAKDLAGAIMFVRAEPGSTDSAQASTRSV